MQEKFDELKPHITDYLGSLGIDVVKASGGRNTFCPVCDGGHKTGCFHFYPETNKVKCFSCGFNGDLFDLIAAHENITVKEAIKVASQRYGSGEPVYNYTQKDTNTPRNKEAVEVDYTAFIKKAFENNNFEYLLKRGISKEIQEFFQIGYVAEWRSPKAPNTVPTSPRCIIPRNAHSYLARDTRQELNDIQKKYAKQNAGKSGLFNIDALNDDTRPIIVVEGEIDCMSVYEAGCNAIALCSVSHVNTFLDVVKEKIKEKNNLSFVLMLDNDEPGKKGQAQLEKGLTELGIPFLTAELPAHDPNDYLIKNRDEFIGFVLSLESELTKIVNSLTENEYNAGELLDYFKNIESQNEVFEVSTGFYNLDRQLGGGISEGLYIIGAISSLGKTTFCLQLADQIAGTGNDVIFFSLEMSKLELMAKSISRHSYDFFREGKTKDGKHTLAKDTQGIYNNRRYKVYTPEEKEAIRIAIEKYEKQAKHLYIYEGRYKGKRLTVEMIKEIVSNHIRKTGNIPVIFIDYLQIVAPTDPRTTDKQNVDNCVYELKEISRKYSLPVFAISSFNRENYNEPVSMSSYKESGSVEYSSDALFGLQLEGMEYKDGETDAVRKKRIRELFDDLNYNRAAKIPVSIELKCLKLRKGYPFKLRYNLLHAYNHYEEMYSLKDFDEMYKEKEKKKGKDYL